MNDTRNRGKSVSLIQRFRRRWEDGAGEYIPVPPAGDLGGELARFIGTSGISSLVIAGPPLTAVVGVALEGNVQVLADFGRHHYERGDAARLCSEAEAGLIGVDALVAETGMLVLASRGRGDRLVSTLPPTLLVVATEAPVFNDLEAFLRSAPHDLSLCFVAGPSRTADIEKQVVLGAHGPTRVVVWGPES